MARLRHWPRTTVAFERWREVCKMGRLVTSTVFPVKVVCWACISEMRALSLGGIDR